jgi:chromosome segregation ATPase
MASVGEERQIAEEGVGEAMEREESIAEGMMSYKKLLALHQGVATLRKTSRTHHEMVVRLEKAMGDTISENDLRRAIGLALEEFDSQLVEAFRDSNRKCISMFAKSEDVAEIQSKIDKKVNFDQYNAVLQKLSELRKYIDTMAESVFIGHQESQEEFAKTGEVEKYLKQKADLAELTQVRAKLERLEAVVTANDMKHNTSMDDMNQMVTKSNASNIQINRQMIEENKNLIAQLQNDTQSLMTRMDGAEEQIEKLNEDTANIAEKQGDIQERQDNVIWRACQSLQGLFQGMEGKVNDLNEDLTDMRTNVDKFQDFATQRIQQLFDDDEQVKEQVRFLMEASEMLKRRSREFTKTHNSQLKDLQSSEAKLMEQMGTLERSFKAHERELRAIEKRTPTLSSALATMASGDILPPVIAEPVPLDPNQNLQNVLTQLEMIANGTPMPSKALMPLGANAGLSPPLPLKSPRPPLPMGPTGSTSTARTQAPRRTPRS